MFADRLGFVVAATQTGSHESAIIYILFPYSVEFQERDPQESV